MIKKSKTAAGVIIAFIVICLLMTHGLNKKGEAVGKTKSSTPFTVSDSGFVQTETPMQSDNPVQTYAPTFSAAPTYTPIPTQTPVPLDSTELRIGRHVKTVYEAIGKFEKKNHRLLYRMASGNVYRSGFFLTNNRVYFAQKNGEIVRGWFRYRGNIYFFSRKNGNLTDKQKVEGVKLGEYGIAKNGAENQERAATYLKAADTLKSISKISDKKSVKLYNCYKWVMQFGYVRHRTMKEMMQRADWQKNWDIVFANDIFDSHSGCCVSYAAAFALLAKECGYKKVTLCCDTGHAWDDIGGRLYDPLFAKARSFEANYNASYSDYRINPAITKRIS